MHPKAPNIYTLLRDNWQHIKLIGGYNATTDKGPDRENDITLSNEDRGGFQHAVKISTEKNSLYITMRDTKTRNVPDDCYGFRNFTIALDGVINHAEVQLQRGRRVEVVDLKHMAVFPAPDMSEAGFAEYVASKCKLLALEAIIKTVRGRKNNLKSRLWKAKDGEGLRQFRLNQNYLAEGKVVVFRQKEHIKNETTNLDERVKVPLHHVIVVEETGEAFDAGSEHYSAPVYSERDLREYVQHIRFIEEHEKELGELRHTCRLYELGWHEHFPHKERIQHGPFRFVKVCHNKEELAFPKGIEPNYKESPTQKNVIEVMDVPETQEAVSITPATVADKPAKAKK